MHRSPAARQAGAPRSPVTSPARMALPAELPTILGVPVTAPDGRRLVIPGSVLRGLAEVPSPTQPYDQLWIFDSGWGGVSMVVELALRRVAAIVHIKNTPRVHDLLKNKNKNGEGGRSS